MTVGSSFCKTNATLSSQVWNCNFYWFPRGCADLCIHSPSLALSPCAEAAGMAFSWGALPSSPLPSFFQSLIIQFYYEHHDLLIYIGSWQLKGTPFPRVYQWRSIKPNSCNRSQQKLAILSQPGFWMIHVGLPLGCLPGAPWLMQGPGGQWEHSWRQSSPLDFQDHFGSPVWKAP